MYEDDKLGVKTFYKGHLGPIFDRLLMPHVHNLLGELSGLSVLVIGPHPPSAKKLENNCRNIQFKDFKGLSVFPFSDGVFDRVVVLHSVEFSEHIKGFLREVWRITAPEGRVVFVIPNRRGLLARSATTPFGYGQPFTKNQFKNILAENMFFHQSFTAALSMPVWSLERDEKIIKFLDRVGQVFWPQFCGAYVVGAKKKIYGVTPLGEKSSSSVSTSVPQATLPFSG